MRKFSSSFALRSFRSDFSVTLIALSASMAFFTPVNAHLMVAQHGTLNFAEEGVFIVLSLPISGFNGIDDDGDGSISLIEFNRHRAAIVASVLDNVILSDKGVRISLQGITLSPVIEHGVSTGAISQLTVLGRFPIVDPNRTLKFHTGIYGSYPDEQILEITAKRPSDNQTQVFELTPKAPDMELFPGKRD